MNKLLSIVVGISAFCVATAQAMPFHAQATLIIPVASGCGLGVHRGPLDGCEPINGSYYFGHYPGYYRAYYNGYYRGYRHGYSDGYYEGSGRPQLVNQGPCRGRGEYFGCNVYGIALGPATNSTLRCHRVLRSQQLNNPLMPRCC